MSKIGSTLVLSVTAAFAAVNTPAQQQAPESSVERGGSGEEGGIGLYEAPASISLTTPEYPFYAARDGQEGWVELNFMVGPDGKAYEVHVADHIGNEAFIDAARDALADSVFSPARIGDEAVHGSSKMMYRFVLTNAGGGARQLFARRYRSFMSTLEDESQSDAEAELAVLEDASIQNNYEYAYLNLARYSYALRYGTSLEQMDYLKKALGESVANPGFESFLGEDAVAARRGLLQLQLRNQYFGEAMDTLELMRLREDEAGIDSFRNAFEQLAEFRNNDQAYGVSGQLGDNGSWFIELFKDGFFLVDLMGEVAELKLRCERRYVFFEFDSETQYNVSDGAGECSLEVIGDAGTTFTLVQL
jgi:TonB family protein